MCFQVSYCLRECSFAIFISNIRYDKTLYIDAKITFAKIEIVGARLKWSAIFLLNFIR